jgi:hypothetical protein
MKKLAETTDAGDKAKLIEDISEAQARINASHPDAYVGGGVAVWVTSREGDVQKIADALGISVEQLTSVTVAKRVTAALSESKWLEAAIKRLSAPGAESLDDIDKLAKAVTNIGKHGARGAEQLGKAGPANVGDLTRLMNELKVWKDASSDVVRARFKGGELEAIRSQLSGLLDQLKGGTKTAVDSLGSEALGAGIDLTKMAEFAKLMDWQATYAVLVDTAKGSTGAYINMLQLAVEAKLAGPGEGEPAPTTEPNYQPGEGEPVFIP